MNKKILLLPVMACFITVLQAQSSKSSTAYAITPPAKGQSDWKEVRLIDIKTGKEIQSVFSSRQDIEILNARTGKPVQKKDMAAKAATDQSSELQVYRFNENNKPVPVNNKAEIEKLKAEGSKLLVVRAKHVSNKQAYDKPFATNSAAMAYDKKHDRLYYTPMGINQLRYIDMKAKTAKIYYFEDEAFGVVKGQHDVPAQITRMVIASDGNGYALSNDAEHLIRFTTGKKPTITDLGSITDDVSNGDNSIHRGMGGDMIADKDGNLYLITAYRNVWKINIENMTATYKGAIKGLPEGYQTNGAVVDDENKILVCSGMSTAGYYRFALEDLQAALIPNEGDVYNASDLANGNLLVTKKEKKEAKEEQAQTKTEAAVVKPVIPVEEIANNNISVYPNPVTDGLVKLAFRNQPTGKYNVQVLDLSGKIISSSDVVLSSKSQVLQVMLPGAIAKGNYFIKVSGEDGRNSLTTKLNVQ